MILLLLPGLLCAEEASFPVDKFKPEIDNIVKPVVEGNWCPAIAVGLIYEGQARVWGYGSTSSKNANPPDGDTVFEIGSITKLFTKLLLSDMVHKNEMDLEDKAQVYLPKGVRMPTKDGKEITLFMLSNHTSGLPRNPEDMDSSHMDPQGGYTIAKLYDYLPKCQLDFAPGKTFHYSNLGVGLLGHLISLKSGLDYGEYLEKRILGPVGMGDTGIEWTVSEFSRAAEGHTADSDPIPHAEWKVSSLAGCGGLHSTINDLFKLGKAVFEKDRSPLGDIAFDPTAEKLDWGPQVTHGGGTFGFTSFFFVDRAKQTILVVWGNNHSEFPSQVASEIMKILKGESSNGIQFPTLVETPSDQLQKYAGQYQITNVDWEFYFKPYPEITLRAQDGRLVATSPNLPLPWGLYPEPSGNFFVKNGGYEIAFSKKFLKGKFPGFSATTQVGVKSS